MMEGIEVLATIPKGTNFVPNFLFATIAGVIVWLGFGIWLGIDSGSIFMGLFFGFLVGGVIFALVVAISEEPTEFVNTYKVTISDDIKLNEFYERYEILEQEGKIFTIKERLDEIIDDHPTL